MVQRIRDLYEVMLSGSGDLRPTLTAETGEAHSLGIRTVLRAFGGLGAQVASAIQGLAIEGVKMYASGPRPHPALVSARCGAARVV